MEQVAVDYGSLIQLVLQIVISVLLPLALRELVKLVNSFVSEKRASGELAKFETAVLIIEQMVLAAEQNGLTGALSNIGQEKKRYVFDMAEAELKRRGITIDIDMLDAMIEAQVKTAIKDVEPIFPAKE